MKLDHWFNDSSQQERAVPYGRKSWVNQLPMRLIALWKKLHSEGESFIKMATHFT
jgi:hypothetical protein